LNIRKGLLRIILPALRRMPPGASARFVAGIGGVEYALFRSLRLRFIQAVERAQDHFGARWDVPAVSRALASGQIRWRIRDQLLDGVTDERLPALFTVAGQEHYDDAAAQGKGVILLGNHFGAHLLPAHWLARQGVPIRLFMERPHHVSRRLGREFETDGPLGQKKLFISRRASAAEAAGSILRAGRILKAGMTILIASDVRWNGQHTAPAAFLGNQYTFSATWVVLAALTGAPVVPVFCKMRPDGTHELEYLPAFQVPADAHTTHQTAHWVQRSVSEIEARVARDPANSNEYFFWSSPDDSAIAIFRKDGGPILSVPNPPPSPSATPGMEAA
jgi:KDO2-lipid IV(A) lauroyltransferase